MKDRRNRAVTVAEAVIALPLLFLLAVLAVEFIEMYGGIVIPVGVAVYLLISLVVDRYFWRQSEALEQVLERRLSPVRYKSAEVQKTARKSTTRKNERDTH